MNEAACGLCDASVDIDSPFTVAVPHRLSPHTQTYYHGRCYDPWSEYTDGVTYEAELNAFEAGLDADPVNSPAHYRWLPNGIEVIDITESFGFLLGNVLKYVMRADHKGKPIEDLKKAEFYLRREIANRESSEVV